MDKVTRQCPQTTTFLKRKESQSSIEPSPSTYQPNALPLGQTGSRGMEGEEGDYNFIPIATLSPPEWLLHNDGINCEGQNHKTVSTDHNFWRERRTEVDDEDGDYFCNALFSAFEQTLCTFVTCDSKWVTVFFKYVLNIHWSGALTFLFDCYMAGATWNCCCLFVICVHHATIHHDTSLHTKPHMSVVIHQRV